MSNAARRRSQDVSEIKRRFRGLDPDAVRVLVERERSQCKDLDQRLRELQAAYDAQRTELDELHGRERQITGALAAAQRAADEIVEDARRDAARYLAEAEANAQRRLDVVEQELAQLTELARTIAGDLIDQAEGLRSTVADARRQFGTAQDEPPPPPARPTGDTSDEVTAASDPTTIATPVSIEPTPPESEDVVVPLDDLPPEGQHIIRVVLAPIGSPAAVAAAERRIHGLTGVRTVRLDDLAPERATLLVGVDTEHLDVAPLLDAGAELISADRDVVELCVPHSWS